MISALEREVIEKFRQLDQAAKRRVREVIDHETRVRVESQTTTFDFDTWQSEVDAARMTLHPDASEQTPTASDLVNETSEERDADILRSLGSRDSTGDRTD